MQIFSLRVLAAAGAMALVGCASPPMSPPAGAKESMSMSQSDGDMTAMCDMHKQMMGSMSPQDQKAMMDAHMKDMSPEMRAKHMEQMNHCK
jgi:hypothetical protein